MKFKVSAVSKYVVVLVFERLHKILSYGHFNVIAQECTR